MATKKKQTRSVWAISLTIGLAVIAALLVSLIWQTPINRALGFEKAPSQSGGSEVQTIGDDLNVHFVDVGQGDAIIVELPDEKKMIIDGGKDKEKQKLLTYIDQTIREADGSKLNSFDYALLTHPDEDHCGGLDDVLQQYPAEVFYRPNVLATRVGFTDPGEAALKAGGTYGQHDTLAYSRTIAAGYNLEQKGGIETEVRITDGNNESICLLTPDGLTASDPDYYTITFYSPLSSGYKDINDYSPIVILEYHGRRVALSGDAEQRAEAEFVAAAAGGKGKYAVFDDKYTVDVIKLGHHGSRTSNTEAYLETLTTAVSRPDVLVVISCGAGNSYGHPHGEVLTRLQSMGFADGNVYRTDQKGNVVLSVRGIESENGPLYRVYAGDYAAPQPKQQTTWMDWMRRWLNWQMIVIVIVCAVSLLMILIPVLYGMDNPSRKAVRQAIHKVSNVTRKSDKNTRKRR